MTDKPSIHCITCESNKKGCKQRDNKANDQFSLLVQWAVKRIISVPLTMDALYDIAFVDTSSIQRYQFSAVWAIDFSLYFLFNC